MSNLHLFLFSLLSGSRNGRFSYGYSSFKGKRSSMEDFFETRISEVDGQMVAFFGVFDGKFQVFILHPLKLILQPPRSPILFDGLDDSVSLLVFCHLYCLCYWVYSIGAILSVIGSFVTIRLSKVNKGVFPIQIILCV